MGCLDVDTIVSFLAGALDAPERAMVEEHVAACADCSEQLSLALAGSTDAGETAAQPPEAQRAFGFARGSAIGRYIILGLVGRGGMGEVYAAYDPELDRRVALKIFRGDRQLEDEPARRGLLREAKALARLRHPNVVAVHDAGTADGQVFLAMEYVEGKTLAHWQAERRRTSDEVLGVFVQAGRGLAAAHAAGLIHRDFKPSNVMIATDGTVRVLDFGLARPLHAAQDPARAADSPAAGADLTGTTETAHTAGTPLYMAPEQFSRQAPGPAADQFSFCVSLYEALYGQRPFAGTTLATLMTAVCSGNVDPPPHRAGVPAALRAILLRGLRARPEDRWPSMEELVARLTSSGIPRRWPRRMAVGLVVAAVLAGGGLWRRHRRALACDGDVDRWAGVWELPDPHRPIGSGRAALREAFRNSGATDWQESWAHTAQALDDYAREWQRTHRDACLATRVRGEQSEESFELRTSCLTERLAHVQGLLEVFQHPTVITVANAGVAVDTLPPLDRCSDLPLLKATATGPEDREGRERVQQLTREIARVKALSDSGQCSESATAWRGLIAQARSLRDPALQARSLLALASISASCVPQEENEAADEQAARIALASGDAETAGAALILDAADKLNRRAAADTALELLELADAVLQRLPHRPAALEGWRLGALALVHARQGDAAAAAATYEQQLSLLRRSDPVNHLDRSFAFLNYGVVLQEEAQPTQALAAYREARAQLERIDGARTAHMGILLSDIAEALNDLGRYAEALASAEQSRAVLSDQHAAPSVLGFTWTMSGEALLGLGHRVEAARAMTQALTLFAGDASPYRAQALFGLARATDGQAAGRARARALAEQALADDQTSGNRRHADRVAAWLRSH
ncbi:MAG TPA: protein kinase [Polyangia bacterium]|nr:protein kinase [Polyangia bacterium]